MFRSARIAGLVLLTLLASARLAEASKIEIQLTQADQTEGGHPYLNGNYWPESWQVDDGVLSDSTREKAWNASDLVGPGVTRCRSTRR